jgi:integrase
LARCELRALRDEDVDLERNVIHVRRGWDDVEGEIEPKSEKGTRKAPIAGDLRRYLLAHRARTGRRGEALFFGPTATRKAPQTRGFPFSGETTPRLRWPGRLPERRLEPLVEQAPPLRRTSHRLDLAGNPIDTFQFRCAHLAAELASTTPYP